MPEPRKLKELLSSLPYHLLETTCCSIWQQYSKNFPALSVKSTVDSLISQNNLESDYILLTLPYEEEAVAATGVRHIVDIIKLIKKSELDEAVRKYGVEGFARVLAGEVERCMHPEKCLKNPETKDGLYFSPSQYSLNEVWWENVANLLVYNPSMIDGAWAVYVATLLYHLTLQGFTQEEFDAVTREHKEFEEADLDEVQNYEEYHVNLRTFRKKLEYTDEQKRLSQEAHMRNIACYDRTLIELIRHIYA